MKRLAKIVGVVLLCLVLLIALVTGWLVYLAKTRLPDLDRTVKHPSLKAEVRVIRDDWGVPHIEAANETDAYFALGYVMAQDRLFQMELVRRLARGELAELAGPWVVPVDKIIRSFRLRAQAEASISDPNAVTPEVKRTAEAFVAGVNHCMATEPLPFEFTVLHIPIRPFTPVDCFAVAAVLPVTFAEGLRTDPLFTLIEERLKKLAPDRDVKALFPGCSKEKQPVTIMETPEEAQAYLDGKRKQAGAAPGLSAAGVESLLEPLLAVSQWSGTTLGSNSWVLGPSRTKSGKPILANDPHIAFTNPGIWYEAHVKYGDFELYGHYLPLIPYALLGHNRHHAWALTMLENDDVDLYRETFKPDDPSKVMYKGAWADARTETETIKVRFGRDQHYAVRVTPHGPVITDIFRTLHGYEGPEIALSWVWQREKYTDVQAFYEMAHARDFDGFGAAVSKITSPGLNVSYADSDGNIAWWAAGLIAIRPKHVNPKTLLEGASGNDEILGYVPFDQNPHLRNPERGCIVTANNKPTVKPVGPVEDLQGYWQPDDRAARIQQLLATQERWSIEELKAVQFDDCAIVAPPIVGAALKVLREPGVTLTPREQQAANLWSAWDYRHGADSAAASMYRLFCDVLLRNVVQDEIGEQLFGIYLSIADSWDFTKYFIHDETSPYWDDLSTAQRETRRDTIVKSFKDTVATLEREIGPDPSRWTWGTIHTIEFKHPFGYAPLLGRIFNVGPFPASGGGDLVNAMQAHAGGPRYAVLAGPSTRRLIDFADPEHSLTVLPTGNSGNFMSRHYSDQARMFMSGQYREPRFTKEQIEANKTHEMCFAP